MSVQRDIFLIEVQMSRTIEYSPQMWVRGIDMLNALSMWEMLRALAAISESKREEVVDAAEKILKDQRRWTGAFNRIAWAADIVTTGQFKSPPSGLFQIRPGMSQSSEETDAKVFLEERRAAKKSEVITLVQPSIATNAAGIGTRYHMQFTEPIGATTPASDIIDLVFRKGSLRHWAISCHGFVNNDGSTRIALGAGLDNSNTALFSKLKGKVDVIWIGGCLPAASDAGKADCKARAMNAGCHLVAPGFLMTMSARDLPMGRMDMNRRFMPVVFTPGGSQIGWDSFLGMAQRLHFTVT